MIPKKLALIVLIVLLINSLFVDLPLFPQRTATRSLMFLFAPAILLLILAISRFRFKIFDGITKIFIVYSISTLAASCAILIIFLPFRGIIVYERNIMVKFIEAFFSLTLLHMIVYFLYINSVYRISYRTFSHIIFATFLLLVIVGIVEYFEPEVIEIFHVQPRDYDRLRLLGAEPSQTVLIFSVVSFLSFLLARRSYVKMAVGLTYFALLYFIASKGIFISMITSVLCLILLNPKSLTSIIAAIPIFVVAIYSFFTIVVPGLKLDITYSSSFITRASGMLSAVYILFTYPFGLGYGTYLSLYPEIVEKTSNFLSKLFRHEFNLSEIYMMKEYGENIGAKSTLAQLVMFNGILGLFFFFFLFYRLYTSSKFVFARFGELNSVAYKFFTLTLFIQLAIGTEYNLLYIIWLYIAFGEAVRKNG
ncbi:MAG: hypothetical protein RML10_10810 [Geminocystis sp.]|nr:hypothetical protein [Geminocystis sp.]